MNNLRKKLLLVIATACILTVTALGHPGSGILIDRHGQIYFIDTGSGLWKIDTRGAVSHLSNLRNHWIAMDPNNRFIQSRVPTDPGRDWVLTSVGSNPTMLISTDFPILIGEDGNLYHPSARETNVRIMRTTPEGRTTAFLTLPRSVAGEALGWINGLTTGPNGSIYYSEDNAIRRITSRGEVSTIATVTPLAKATGIPGIEERPYLRGLKVDANGVVHVADNADARVLKIMPDGKVTTLLQLETPWAPTDVAVFGGNVYVLEYLHTPGDDRLQWMPRIRSITPDGKSTIILTVDQMPGARAPKPAASSVSQKSFWGDLLDLWLRSYFVSGSRSAFDAVRRSG